MIAIVTISCAKDRGAKQDAVRETWAKNLPCRHIFLLGRGNTNLKDDEWAVNADDSYAGLTEKLRAFYCDATQIDHTFISCIDTYIVPARLLALPFPEHNFVGRPCENEPHASGGNGYWLDRLARSAIAIQDPFPGYADQADFRALAAAGIKLHPDNRIGSSATKHLSRGTGNYDPAWMYETHRKFLEQPLD